MRSQIKQTNVNRAESSIQALIKLPVKFKRYSFISKSCYCSYMSMSLFKNWMETGNIFDSKEPYPWELSVFTMLAMLDGEYQNNEMTQKEASRLLLILRKNQYGVCTVENVDKLFAYDVAMVQIKYQMNVFLLRERYVYFFSFVSSVLNMKEQIKKKVGVSSDVIIETLLLIICAANDGKLFEDILAKLVCCVGLKPTKDFLDLLKRFSLPRAEYARLQREKINIANNLGRGCVASYNLLERYPFIVEDNITYLPNMYLGMFALTDKLLNQITEGDNNLRSLIGKEVVESYVFNIIKKAGVYASVRHETMYGSGGKESRSPDVCVEHRGKVLFLELKLCQPSMALHNLEEKDSEKLIDRYVAYLLKFIKHISERDKYLMTKYDNDNVYGLLVLYEDSFIFRCYIFDKLKKSLKGEDIDPEWLRSNVHIVGLYEIERFAYSKKDMFQFLDEWKRDKKKKDDYFIPCEEEFNFRYPNFEELLKNPNKAFAHLFTSCY